MKKTIIYSILFIYRFSEGAKQRVIRMVEAQVDPMEPPKHKFKKVPRGPPSPPVPVLHSPPRKLTVADQQAWKIPPCISNWKNARGYTIPLDKRLAADGRGLQEITINNKFASFSETLYIAERKAAEDLRIRNTLRKKMAMKEKEDKEKDLREMANKARQERASVLAGGGAGGGGSRGEGEQSYYGRTSESNEEDNVSDSRQGRDVSPEDTYGRRRSDGGQRSDDEDRHRNARRRSRSRSPKSRRSPSVEDREDQRDSYGRDRYGESEEDRQARLQRERLRIERRKERERELRLENMKVLLCILHCMVLLYDETRIL